MGIAEFLAARDFIHGKTKAQQQWEHIQNEAFVKCFLTESDYSDEDIAYILGVKEDFVLEVKKGIKK